MNRLITLPEGEAVEADYLGPLVEPVIVELEIENENEDEDEDEDEPQTEILDGLSAEQLATLPEGVVSRTEPPNPLPVLESQLPAFETFSLSNGLEVIFVEQHELPELQLQLVVGASNVSVPQDQQGLADFMADLLTKGTETRSAMEIAQQIEAVGGDVSSDAGLESITLSLNAPSTESPLAFDLLSDIVLHPTFPEKELGVSLEQTLTFLEQYEINPDTLANRQFGRLAYGGHPYSYYMTADTVNNISRDDLVDYYETYFKPNNALLVIVGDLSLSKAKIYTKQKFGQWKTGEVPDYLDYPTAQLGDTSQIYLVDRPEAEQATVQIGNKGINALNPDRYALRVVNTVLGAGASSRLFANLREDKGYTYGVYSRFGQASDTSTFRVLTDVGQEHAGEAIQEVLTELERIRTEEISEEEMQAAKGLIIGNFALGIEDPADFASQLSFRHRLGVPLEELNDYLQTIEAITPSEALSAAAEYIDSEQPIIVVVGNAKLLKSQLEALGSVVVVDSDGNVIEDIEE